MVHCNINFSTISFLDAQFSVFVTFEIVQLLNYLCGFLKKEREQDSSFIFFNCHVTRYYLFYYVHVISYHAGISEQFFVFL